MEVENTAKPGATDAHADAECTQIVDLFKNADYSLLHSHLQVYKHQLHQCDQDIEDLRHLKEEAMEYPEFFIKTLQKRKEIPTLQSISMVPELDLQKYRNIHLKSSLTSTLLKRNRVSASSPISPSSDANTAVEELLAQISQLQESFKKDLEVPKSWSCVLDITGRFEPSHSVLELKKMRENLAKYRLDDSSMKKTFPAVKPKQIGYAPVRQKPSKKKRNLSIFTRVARGRGRPPGLMKKTPWTEPEITILKEWIKTHESDMKRGYYEEIHRKLRARPPSEIREKVQNLLNEDLALFDSDEEHEASGHYSKDDPIYDGE
ncbi:hypothetical protein MDAP_000861 [Mitosporidium daphniae]